MKEKEDFATYYLVIARDTDMYGVVRCIRCGGVASEVHEILPRSRFGPLRRRELFEVRNRVSICRGCHELVHNDKGRGDLFYRLEKLYGYEYDGEARCILDSYKESLSSHTDQ